MLYPQNKPKGTIDKEPVTSFLKSDVKVHSFDTTKKYGYIDNKIPIIRAFYDAYLNHYPIRIKPDDIWLLIVQAFSNHVNFNSEELREMFVNFKGKKTLSIYYRIEKEEELKKSFRNFSGAINKKMKEYLGEELLDNWTPNFSTTNDDISIIYKLTVMAVFKKYFNYEMHVSAICGIPYIILEGTLEDYE